MSGSIVLASTSFRRQQLLRWLGIDFQVVPPDFEEHTLPFHADDPEGYVKVLAIGKALSVQTNFPKSLIIGSDTIVVSEQKLYGKPINIDHARQTLSALRGKTHQVYTAVTVISTIREPSVIVEKTDVTFRPFTDIELEAYLRTGESLGKAGAYAIQDGAKNFVQKVDGSTTNVLGLPLIQTAKLLRQFGVEIPVNVEGTIKSYLGVES